MRRALVAMVTVAVGAVGLSACQTGVKMWDACTPADGNPTGTDGTYVLVCQQGEWVPIMTVAEFVAKSRGENPTIAPLPERPTTTTTSTTTTSTTTTSTSVVTPVAVPHAVDQEYDEPTNASLILAKETFPVAPAPVELWQTFTAGVTGSLDMVSLNWAPFGNSGPVPVQVRITAVDSGSGLPTGPAQGSGTYLQGPAGGGFKDMALDVPASVQAGTRYAIVWAFDRFEMGANLPIGQGYAGGQLGVGTAPQGTWSLMFRTWVVPA